MDGGTRVVARHDQQQHTHTHTALDLNTIFTIFFSLDQKQDTQKSKKYNFDLSLSAVLFNSSLFFSLSVSLRFLDFFKQINYTRNEYAILHVYLVCNSASVSQWMQMQ